MPRDPESAPFRVGLRDIARAANVCLMTASLAMRQSPKISAATGARVRAIADRLGYRPDPEISRLMGRLRLSRQRRGTEMIALIDFRREAPVRLHPYDSSILEGITARADALGFGITVFRFLDYECSLKKLLRVVRHRGISAAILLPSNQAQVVFDPEESWEGLSVVSATTAVLTPRFHQVVPNQLYNMMTMIERMHERGCRRIGAVLNETLDRRTKHHYSLALTWHGHRDRILLLPGATTVSDHVPRVSAWLRTAKPDAVATEDADAVAALVRAARLERRIQVVSLNSRDDEKMPYQDQHPRLIGETAMSLVSGMLHNHETGIPARALVTTIDGDFNYPPAARALRPPSTERP